LTVLLTGGSGFLGSHVAAALVSAGYGVRALVRRSSNRRFLASLGGVEFTEGTVEDEASCRAAMAGVDAVIHVAGLVKARSPAEFHRTNVEGTRHLLDAAVAVAPHIVRFVQVSSLAAIGPSFDGRPVDPDAGSGPVTHYGRSKRESDDLARSYADRLPVTILRPPMIYGPRDPETLTFFKAVNSRVVGWFGDGNGKFSAISGPDCASACVAALTAPTPSGNAYFVEDGELHTMRELLAGIEEAFGKKAWVHVSVPLWALSVAAFFSELWGRATGRAVMLTRDKCNELRCPNWVCDSTLARRDLSWKSTWTWAQGARETARWYRDSGWL